MEGGTVFVSKTLSPGVLTPAAQKRLGSGNPAVIVTRVYLIEASTGVVLAANARICRVAYDFWSEVFRIADDFRSYITVNMRGVLRICLQLGNLPLTPATPIVSKQTYQVVAITETDPANPTHMMISAANKAGSSLLPLLKSPQHITGGGAVSRTEESFIAP